MREQEGGLTVSEQAAASSFSRNPLTPPPSVSSSPPSAFASLLFLSVSALPSPHSPSVSLSSSLQTLGVRLVGLASEELLDSAEEQHQDGDPWSYSWSTGCFLGPCYCLRLMSLD